MPTDNVSTPESTKFSRYRSVRKAQEQKLEQLKQHQPPAMPSQEPQKDQAVIRSMSRYHRQHPTTSGSNTQKLPPVHASPAVRRANTQHQLDHASASLAAAHATSNSRIRAGSTPVTSQQQQQQLRNGSNAQSKSPPSSRTPPEPVPLVKRGAREPPPTAREEARQLIQGETERQKQVQAKLRADKRAKLEAEQAERDKLERAAEEAERIRAQQEAEEAERLRLEKEAELLERGKRLQKAESASRIKASREEEERQARLKWAQESTHRVHKPVQLNDDLADHEPQPQTRPQTRHQTSPQQTPQQTPPPPSPSKQGMKLGIFKRRKAEDSPENPATTSKSKQRSNTIANDNGPPTTIIPGGGGAVPGIDAPKSAVNAGDRRVRVECNKSFILLPVTPTTTPLDLIRSASTCLSEPINAKASVLLESFSKVGLQRPLRHYEHVRDVMNSWDDDKQFSLVLVDSASGGIDEELSSSQVPSSRPDGITCFIQYSQKPGKWSKRWVTLRSDGQMLLAKNEAGKESANVCHLSDFDIYSPTPRKLKSVRPPKKICFAVKSQQKSSIFTDESSFVHFFSIPDKETGTAFYKAIQGWRSWYLVNVMGEGQQKPKAADSTGSNGYSGDRNMSGSKPQSNVSGLHTRNASVDSHYQLGTFSPLLDLSQFGQEDKRDRRGETSFANDMLSAIDTKALHSRKLSTRIKGYPPVSYKPGHISKDSISHNSNRLNSLTQSTSSHSADEETFAPTGLLGRTYSQRQRQQQEREKKNTPFTDGPSLLNSFNATTSYITHASFESAGGGGGLGRNASVRSTTRSRESSDLHRNSSTRVKPKPLIDLTPQYREPPQHARKGKGFVPDTMGTQPLISSATSPEEAIKIPPSTDWRARPSIPAGAGIGHGTYGGGGHERTRSLRVGGGGAMPTGLAAYAANNHSGAPEDETDAFTGRGLLAHTGFSQGGVGVGHGVMDGSKAKGPMLDVSDRSQFVPGSLLAGVEKVQGPAGPVIEREKRRSWEVSVGEGM
ncbi:hypothetical protein K432DRAFT_296510 [Lepidopterella palustris CBS 459.81]|uniref:PH domain-containing protein n=1 Tax=Lepidopterella palustris CBS 459.81 TaxID=1314670 RepID=A0A8E2EC29_9PEZI|nr:hypothetical protein K432DRAFT_296510 [Lepidopterella palustris CBS 459.81]